MKGFEELQHPEKIGATTTLSEFKYNDSFDRN